MGSPNHYDSKYPTLGFNVDPDTSENAISDYRVNCLEDEENNIDHDDYVADEDIIERLYRDENDYAAEMYKDVESLAKELNDWIENESSINAFCEFSDPTCPFKFKFETGYHDGFRIAIVSNWGIDHWFTLEKAYDSSVSYKQIPQGMTFEQFKNCYEKVEQFCIYTIQQLGQDTPFYGISGGWVGGRYDLSENTQDEHDKFKALYEQMMVSIKREMQLPFSWE